MLQGSLPRSKEAHTEWRRWHRSLVAIPATWLSNVASATFCLKPALLPSLPHGAAPWRLLADAGTQTPARPQKSLGPFYFPFWSCFWVYPTKTNSGPAARSLHVEGMLCVLTRMYPQLFDLKVDPSERNDLSQDRPEAWLRIPYLHGPVLTPAKEILGHLSSILFHYERSGRPQVLHDKHCPTFTPRSSFKMQSCRHFFDKPELSPSMSKDKAPKGNGWGRGAELSGPRACFPCCNMMWKATSWTLSLSRA